MKIDGLKDVELGPLKPVKTGKVRAIYELEKYFLFVATDRISAFDHILPNVIPDKGKVLTQISKFWFSFLQDIIPHHFVTDNINDYPEYLQRYSSVLSKRSMLVKKASVIPIECVVRGYISGSAWKEYQDKQTVNGISLPEGFKESQKLKEPLFTPSTKAETGHDENITFEEMINITGKETAETLKEKSLAIYTKARNLMETKGIILADTKFEFGFHEGKIILIDEVLTPDSSRFWPKDKYEIGRGQESYDKQFVRDYLNEIQWNRQPPVPDLPVSIVENTRKKYLEIYKVITGQSLD